MALSPPELLMRSLLVERGFSFDAPDARIAWEAFKQFAQLEIPRLPTYCVGYECLHDDSRDNELLFNVVRRPNDSAARADPEMAGYDYGCLLSCVVPPELWGLRESDWWWPQCETFEEWVQRVQAKKGFATCMEIRNWKWERFGD